MRDFFREMRPEFLRGMIALHTDCGYKLTRDDSSGSAGVAILPRRNITGVPPAARIIIDQINAAVSIDPDAQFDAVAVYWTLGALFKDGLHHMEVSGDLFDAFSHMDLPIDSSNYHQPFPTMIMTCPDRYPNFGIVNHYAQEAGVLMNVHCLDNAEDVIVGMGRGQVLFGRGTAYLYDETLEDSLRNIKMPESSDMKKALGSMGLGPDDLKVFMRVSYNAMLYATHYGYEKLPDTNHVERICRRLDKAIRRKDKDLEQLNRAELLKQPITYQINQTVPLWREETVHDRDGEDTGRHVKAHWRRGHWRQQPHGPGGTLRKLIAIPAVLVNGHLFGGDRSQTRSTIKG